MGKTITGKVTKTVTLGVNGYTSPLTIAATGYLDPTLANSDGLYVPGGMKVIPVIVNDGGILSARSSVDNVDGVYLAGAALLTNNEAILGGYGNNTGSKGYGFAGGNGVVAKSGATIANAANAGIAGGSGGGGYSFGGRGGYGVEINGTSTLANAGNIYGGWGGPSVNDGGNGGIGVVLASGASGSNQGAISGGFAGYSEAGYAAGAGGAGVDLIFGTLTNLAKGSIIGGDGGDAEQTDGVAGVGGAGVELFLSGTLTNAGTITGGTGGITNSEFVNTDYLTRAGSGGEGVAISGSETTLNNTGTIFGGAGGGGPGNGGQGGYGAVLKDGATGSNAGLIMGGHGGDGGASTRYIRASYGGAGVSLLDSSFFNTGRIIAGEAGSIASGVVATGNVGVNLLSSYLYNSGTIIGSRYQDGVSAATSSLYGSLSTIYNKGAIIGGARGGGVFSADTNFDNAGTITGGKGGGYGVVLAGAGRDVNSGLILGGSFYYGGDSGPASGLGAGVAAGATLDNTGAIYGGDGFAGQDGGAGAWILGGVLINGGTIGSGRPSTGAYAVQFYGRYYGAGTLEVLPGAVFLGKVVAQENYADVLELGGDAPAVLTGIGTQFTNFNTISFAAGAEFTAEGNVTGLASGQQINGFGPGDVIVLDGFANDSQPSDSGNILYMDNSALQPVALTFGTNLTGDIEVTTDGTNTTLTGYAGTTGNTLGSGTFELVLDNGFANKTTVQAGGELEVYGGGQVTSVTVETQGNLAVQSGGTATHVVVETQAAVFLYGEAVDTTVEAGGYIFDVGGVASNTTLAGGELQIADASIVKGALEFKGTGGVLVVDQAKLPTVTISGFAAGDDILLLKAAASGKVTVAKAGVVTVSAGGKTYELDIAGAMKGSKDFVYSDYTLTEKTTSSSAKMAFVAPPASAAPAAAALPDLVTAGGYQAMAAPAPSVVSAATSAYGALATEPLFVPHGGIQTMVTLQT